MQLCTVILDPYLMVFFHTCGLLFFQSIRQNLENLSNYYFNWIDGIKNIAEGTSQLHNETTKMPQRCKLKDGRCARWPVFIDKGHKQGSRKVWKFKGASSNPSPFRGVARGGQGGLEFGRSMNPIQTRGADYAPHTMYCQPPRIQKGIYTTAF